MRIDSHNMRVHLRTPAASDAESIAKNANDYDIAHDVATMGDFPYPYKVEDAMKFISSAINTLHQGVAYHFAICLKDSDIAIGACGIYQIDSRNKSGEIGYWLGKEYWGKGYAKEALALLLQFGFERLQLNRMYAYTFATNSRSINLLQAMGFHNEGTLRASVMQEGKFVDNMLFGKLASEHEQIKIEVND